MDKRAHSTHKVVTWANVLESTHAVVGLLQNNILVNAVVLSCRLFVCPRLARKGPSHGWGRDGSNRSFYRQRATVPAPLCYVHGMLAPSGNVLDKGNTELSNSEEGCVKNDWGGKRVLRFLRRRGVYQKNVWPQEKTTGETHSEVGRHDTSGVGLKKRRSKQGRPTKRWGDDLNTHSQSDRSNKDDNDLTIEMIWLATAENSSKWDAVESDFISSTLTHEQTTYTTDAHDQNEDDTKDDDDTLLTLSHTNAPLHQSYNMMGTCANSSNQGFS